MKIIVGLDVLGGVISLLGGILITVLGGAFLSGMSKSGASAGALGVIAGAFGIALVIGGIITLVLAWGLWNMKGWARIIASIFYAIGLLGFPVGTIVSIIFLYVLWFDPATKACFA